MDAIALLKSDHDRVKSLFAQFEDNKENEDEKRKIAETIISEMMIHERIEEDVFYPAYRQAADKEGRELVAESVEEHHVVDLIVEELQTVELDDEQFDAKFKVLKENVEHHIKEEEEEMFPDAKKIMDKATLDELGDVMFELKTNLMREIVAAKEVEAE